MEMSWEDIVKQAKTKEEEVFKNKGELCRTGVNTKGLQEKQKRDVT